jgi:hypothetical protein
LKLSKGLSVSNKDWAAMMKEGFRGDQGPLTQEVDYLPFKQRVVGSSPARPTIFD